MKKLSKRLASLLLSLSFLSLLGLTGCKGGYRLEYDQITLDGERCWRLLGITDVTAFMTDSVEVDIPTQFQGLPVRIIGERAFLEMPGTYELTRVTIPEGIKIIEKDAFSCADIKSLNIPDSVTQVGDYAFSLCMELEEITIGSGLQSIGERAFDVGSDGLKKIVVSQENQRYHSEEQCLIDRTTGEVILGCKNTVLPLDGSLQSIGFSAFEYSKFPFGYFRVPEGVNTLDKFAFTCCKNLEDVVVPKSMRLIGLGAFEGCDRLTRVYFGGNEEEWLQIQIDERNDELKNATVYYYSEEEKPTGSQYWYFDGGDFPAKW